MKFKCGCCSHVFDEHEAKCENWQHPELNFLCPNCETYLERPTLGAADTAMAKRLQRALRDLGFMALGAVFSAMLLRVLFRAEDSLALGILAAMAGYGGWRLFRGAIRPQVARPIGWQES